MDSSERLSANAAVKSMKDYSDNNNSPRRLVIAVINKKKKCNLVVLAVPVDHRVKIKERENIIEYFNLAREWKKRRT